MPDPSERDPSAHIDPTDDWADLPDEFEVNEKGPTNSTGGSVEMRVAMGVFEAAMAGDATKAEALVERLIEEAEKSRDTDAEE